MTENPSPLKSELERILAQYQQEMTGAEEELRSITSSYRMSLEHKKVEEIRDSLTHKN